MNKLLLQHLHDHNKKDVSLMSTPTKYNLVRNWKEINSSHIYEVRMKYFDCIKSEFFIFMGHVTRVEGGTFLHFEARATSISGSSHIHVLEVVGICFFGCILCI